jgi:hypothetical protein
VLAVAKVTFPPLFNALADELLRTVYKTCAIEIPNERGSAYSTETTARVDVNQDVSVSKLVHSLVHHRNEQRRGYCRLRLQWTIAFRLLVEFEGGYTGSDTTDERCCIN